MKELKPILLWLIFLILFCLAVLGLYSFGQWMSSFFR